MPPPITHMGLEGIMFSHCPSVCVCVLTYVVRLSGRRYRERQQQQQQQPFNGLFSRTTWVSRYQKGKTSVDFTGARDSEWQWHQLGYMQVCTSLQTDNHASTPPLSFFTGRMPFLPPNQQRQSTEGTGNDSVPKIIINDTVIHFVLQRQIHFGNFKP